MGRMPVGHSHIRLGCLAQNTALTQQEKTTPRSKGPKEVNLCTARDQTARTRRAILKQEATEGTESSLGLCWLCFLLFRIRMSCLRPKVAPISLLLCGAGSSWLWGFVDDLGWS